MTDKRRNKFVWFFILMVVFIYIGFAIYPAKLFYDFKYVDEAQFKPKTINIFEIRKKFVLLPGPPSLWAVKIRNGYEVYRNFTDARLRRSEKKLSFPLNNLSLGTLLRTDDIFEKLPTLTNKSITEKLIVQFDQFDVKNWSIYGGFKISPDRRRIAYVDRVEGKLCIAADGIKGKLYTALHRNSLEFSPDSKRIAYLAQVKNKRCYIVDGVEQKPYDELLVPISVFSPDSRRTAYVARSGNKWFAVIDGKESKQYDKPVAPCFSPDGKRIGYSVEEGDQKFMVMDDVAGKRYDDVSRPIFSPDSKRIAYIAKIGNKRSVVIDGVEGNHYDSILRSPVFSPDSTRTVYVARKGKKYFAVLDGVELKHYDYESTKNYVSGALIDSPVFSPDSSKVAYKIEKDGKELMVVNEVEGKKYSSINNLPVFSPDSQRIAYYARLNKKSFVVINGIEGKKYDERIVGFLSKFLFVSPSLQWSIFSPNSKRTAYAVAGKGMVRIIVDEKFVGQHDSLTGSVVFSPHSKHAVYIGRNGDKDFIIIKGVGKKEYDMAGLFGSGIVFNSNDSFHFMALKDHGVYLVTIQIGDALKNS